MSFIFSAVPSSTVRFHEMVDFVKEVLRREIQGLKV